MEPDRPQPDAAPGRPQNTRPGQPGRSFVNDFAPRRPVGSDVTPARPLQNPEHPPVVNPVSTAQPAADINRSALKPMQPAPNASDSQKKPKSVSDADFTRGLQDDDSHESHAPKEPHRTGHAGLVGMVVFVLLGAALLSPFIPGKIFSNFPGSSASSSSGDQELACADAVKNTSSADKYDSKLGSPIVYQYSTTTTQTGTCDGKSQTAVTGHTSQFNPLAAIVNLAIALVIAIVIAKIWRKIFSRHR